jgi:hypothetical protein
MSQVQCRGVYGVVAHRPPKHRARALSLSRARSLALALARSMTRLDSHQACLDCEHVTSSHMTLHLITEETEGHTD